MQPHRPSRALRPVPSRARGQHRFRSRGTLQCTARQLAGAETQGAFRQQRGREAGHVCPRGAAVTPSGSTTPAMLPRRRPGVVEVLSRWATLYQPRGGLLVGNTYGTPCTGQQSFVASRCRGIPHKVPHAVHCRPYVPVMRGHGLDPPTFISNGSPIVRSESARPTSCSEVSTFQDTGATQGRRM